MSTRLEGMTDADYIAFLEGQITAMTPKCADRIVYLHALEKIAKCPNPDSVEDCHDRMNDIALDAIGLKDSKTEA